MDKESLELQQKLLDKLDEWYNSPEFGKSKYDMQKYNRARGMLQATHPKVLTEVLGITSVPDVPRDAMVLIRGMDLSTLKNLEIFQGLDDKVVGHHMSAFGAIRNALNKQSPERRLELLNRAIDSGYITGMDPAGIGPIRTSIHIPVAHEGDQSGKKPGYKITREWTNDDNIEDIWTDLERSLRQQKDSFFEANQYGSTQDLGAASRGMFDGEDFFDPANYGRDDAMGVRKKATQSVKKPTVKELQQILKLHAGNPEEIEAQAKQLMQGLSEKEQIKMAEAARASKGLPPMDPSRAAKAFGLGLIPLVTTSALLPMQARSAELARDQADANPDDWRVNAIADLEEWVLGQDQQNVLNTNPQAEIGSNLGSLGVMALQIPESIKALTTPPDPEQEAVENRALHDSMVEGVQKFKQDPIGTIKEGVSGFVDSVGQSMENPLTKRLRESREETTTQNAQLMDRMGMFDDQSTQPQPMEEPKSGFDSLVDKGTSAWNWAQSQLLKRGAQEEEVTVVGNINLNQF